MYISGFESLRDIGVEYTHKSKEAGNKIVWVYYDVMTQRASDDQLG